MNKIWIALRILLCAITFIIAGMAALQMIRTMMDNDFGTRGVTEIAASVFAVAFWLVIALWLYPKSEKQPVVENSDKSE